MKSVFQRNVCPKDPSQNMFTSLFVFIFLLYLVGDFFIFLDSNFTSVLTCNFLTFLIQNMKPDTFSFIVLVSTTLQNHYSLKKSSVRLSSDLLIRLEPVSSVPIQKVHGELNWRFTTHTKTEAEKKLWFLTLFLTNTHIREVRPPRKKDGCRQKEQLYKVYNRNHETWLIRKRSWYVPNMYWEVTTNKTKRNVHYKQRRKGPCEYCHSTTQSPPIGPHVRKKYVFVRKFHIEDTVLVMTNPLFTSEFVHFFSEITPRSNKILISFVMSNFLEQSFYLSLNWIKSSSELNNDRNGPCLPGEWLVTPTQRHRFPSSTVTTTSWPSTTKGKSLRKMSNSHHLPSFSRSVRLTVVTYTCGYVTQSRRTRTYVKESETRTSTENIFRKKTYNEY